MTNEKLYAVRIRQVSPYYKTIFSHYAILMEKSNKIYKMCSGNTPELLAEYYFKSFIDFNGISYGAPVNLLKTAKTAPLDIIIEMTLNEQKNFEAKILELMKNEIENVDFDYLSS